MSITRRQLLTAAHGELGISNEFDVSPEELEDGVGELNRFMASKAVWRSCGYSPGDGLDEETGLPDTAEGAVAMNLALRLAPGFGKVPSPELKRDARLAYLALLAQKARPIPVQLPAEMPSGAGNRRYSNRNYISPPSDPAESINGSTIDGVDFE